LDRIIAAEAPEVIVVGEPRLMSGDIGEQAQLARAFADRLRQRVSIPVEMFDERLTTVEASRRRAESASTTSIDSLAACVLLEAWLAAR
jgi:putative Holliday junction resolvase